MLRSILVLAALLPTTALAGSHAGALKLSGQAGFAFSSGKTTADGAPGELKSTAQSGKLDGYYLFHANFGVGAWLEYASAKLESGGATFLDQRDLLAGPALTVEYPVTPEVHLFADGAYLFGKTTITADGEEDSESSQGFGVGGGLAWFPVHAVSLDLGVRYSSLKAKVQGLTTTTATFGVQVGFSVYFGGGSSDGWGSGAREGGARAPTTGAGNPSPW